MVKVNSSLSSMFTLERGVLQGSVLSPVLFSLIMDPLLRSLQSKGMLLIMRPIILNPSNLGPCHVMCNMAQKADSAVIAVATDSLEGEIETVDSISTTGTTDSTDTATAVSLLDKLRCPDLCRKRKVQT